MIFTPGKLESRRKGDMGCRRVQGKRGVRWGGKKEAFSRERERRERRQLTRTVLEEKNGVTAQRDTEKANQKLATPRSQRGPARH